MRLPRVRITLSTLLFVVILVAWDCWYFRPSYERRWWRLMDDGAYEMLPAKVGTLPLIDATLLSLWGLAVRRLRRRVRSDRADARPSVPAFTYFSLHLLALGALVVHVAPDILTTVEQRLDAVVSIVACRWRAAFGDPQGTRFAWVAFATLLLGILVSAPTLLLAWIGRVVATRYVPKVSRLRGRVMSGLVSLCFAGVALAVAIEPRRFEYEEQEVTLPIRIVDDASGRPVSQAFVRLSDPFADDPNEPAPCAFTDSDGHARLASYFAVQGERSAFWTTGEFSPWGRWLEVTAPGHRTRRIPLTDVLGPIATVPGPQLKTVTLARGQTPPNSFRDLAGIYICNRGLNVSEWFQVEPDGRFAWNWCGCIPPGYQEYGHLKRIGDSIRFVKLPHPGEEEIDLSAEYRTVEWGDHLYLTRTSRHDLDEFCRAALSADREPDPGDLDAEFHLNDISSGYLRSSDFDRPRTGLPRLTPDVWLAFFVDELRLDNEAGTLRLILDPLNPWHR